MVVVVAVPVVKVVGLMRSGFRFYGIDGFYFYFAPTPLPG
jgi:hypothetical protein